ARQRTPAGAALQRAPNETRDRRRPASGPVITDRPLGVRPSLRRIYPAGAQLVEAVAELGETAAPGHGPPGPKPSGPPWKRNPKSPNPLGSPRFNRSVIRSFN